MGKLIVMFTPAVPLKWTILQELLYNLTFTEKWVLEQKYALLDHCTLLIQEVEFVLAKRSAVEIFSYKKSWQRSQGTAVDNGATVIEWRPIFLVNPEARVSLILSLGTFNMGLIISEVWYNSSIKVHRYASMWKEVSHTSSYSRVPWPQIKQKRKHKTPNYWPVS